MVIAYFSVLSCHSPGEMEETIKTLLRTASELAEI
jgi:hypothetical protein